jgi:small-conductance mechanosensitive channel
MAEGARDWTKFLKGRPDPAASFADLAEVVRPAANDRQESAAEPTPATDVEVIDVWSETLARVHGAADLLRTREQELRDLERRHEESVERAADRIAALEGQLAAEAQRAERAERAQAEAEEWLGRIHKAIVENIAR